MLIILCIFFSSGVRLGEWDLSQETDCDKLDPDFCSDKPIDLDVDEIVVHMDYNSSSQLNEHDIALIRLSRKVNSTGEFYSA